MTYCRLQRRCRASTPVAGRARVREMVGLLVASDGPAAAVGDFCEIRLATRPDGARAGDRIPRRPRAADAARRDRRPAAGRHASWRVQEDAASRSRPATAGPRTGRIRQAAGRQGPAIGAGEPCTTSTPQPPGPLEREHITEPLVTGIRAIDSLLTCGKGQRIGIFGGSRRGQEHAAGRDGAPQLRRRQRDRADRRAQSRSARISSKTSWARRG